MNPVKLDELLDFQTDEWAAGRRPTVESLVEANPSLAQNNELLLDLIYNEVILREQHRQRPQLRDYVSRFPQLEAELKRQFEVHGVMGSSLAPIHGKATPPASILAGRYQTTAFHAAGGLGYVYRASDRELNRTVALKCMKEPAGAESPLTKRFLEEAEITSLLEHPTIVPVHGSGVTTDGRPYYAMRFVEGETLEFAAKKLHASKDVPALQSADFRRLLRAIVDVCDAVAYAHSKNILHRDLKPANILLGPYGETLLLDWGLAKQLGKVHESPRSISDEPATDQPSSSEVDTADKTNWQGDTPPAALTFLGKAKGSPAFMSPEQARGDWQAVSVASDIYSLGATLYYLLTGQLAYTAQSSHSVIEQVGKGEFASPKAIDQRVPAALSAITCKAMALAPKERYGSAQELAKDLERWMADEPVSAHADSAVVRLGRWARRHRTLVAACAVALVVASIGLAVGAWRVGVANFALTQAKEQEKQQRQLANQRLSESLDEQFSLITEIQSELSKAPGTRKVRERLVKGAMAKLEKLIASASEIEDIQMAIVAAHRALGGLYKDVDLDLVKADAEYGTAATLAEALYRKQPNVDSVRLLWFECLADHCALRINRGHYGAAETMLKTMEKLAPDVKGGRESSTATVARTQSHLANVRGDYPMAIQQIQKTRDYWRAAPPSEDQLAKLSDLACYLGSIEYASGDFDQSLAEYTDALAMIRELIKTDPTNLAYQLKLAELCRLRGELAHARSYHESADEHYSEAIHTAQAIVDRDPDNTGAKEKLADAKAARSGVHADRGELVKALELNGSARALYEELQKLDDANVSARTCVAQSYMRDGKVFETQGKIAEAAKARAQSVSLLQELKKLAPDRLVTRAELADALRDLAEFRLAFQNDEQGGFDAFAEASVELNLLAKADPTNVLWQDVRICNLMDIARWKKIREKPGVEEAVEEGMRAVAALPATVKASPMILDQIAFLQRTLAESFIQKKRYEEAEKVLREELAQLEKFKSEMPQEHFVWRHLRTLYGQMSTVKEAKQDPDGAISYLRLSVEAGREMEKRFPDYDRQNQSLPEKLELLADRIVSDHPDEALTVLEEAIARYDVILPDVAARYHYRVRLGIKQLKAADLSSLLFGNSAETITRYDKAASYFEKCITRDAPQPASQETIVATAFLAWSRCSACENALKLGDLDRALSARDELVHLLASTDEARLGKVPIGKDAILWRNDHASLPDMLPEALQSHETIVALPGQQRFLALQSRIGLLIKENDLEQAAHSIEFLAVNANKSHHFDAAARMYGKLFEKSGRKEASYRDNSLKALRTAIKLGHFKHFANKAITRLTPEFAGFRESAEFEELFKSPPSDAPSGDAPAKASSM